MGLEAHGRVLKLSGSLLEAGTNRIFSALCVIFLLFLDHVCIGETNTFVQRSRGKIEGRLKTNLEESIVFFRIVAALTFLVVDVTGGMATDLEALASVCA